jgi:hypothetical protein
MKNWVLVAAITLAGVPVRADLADYFFQPEFVLRHAAMIGMSKARADEIRKDVIATRLKLVDSEGRKKRLELQLEQGLAEGATAEVLIKLTEDLAAAESEMRRMDLNLSIRVRQALQPAEISRLTALRMTPHSHEGAEPATPAKQPSSRL